MAGQIQRGVSPVNTRKFKKPLPYSIRKWQMALDAQKSRKI
nr:MAG TPA: hypothetical protein [Caudoviricetes sp.]